MPFKDSVKYRAHQPNYVFGVPFECSGIPLKDAFKRFSGYCRKHRLKLSLTHDEFVIRGSYVALRKFVRDEFGEDSGLEDMIVEARS